MKVRGRGTWRSGIAFTVAACSVARRGAFRAVLDGRTPWAETPRSNRELGVAVARRPANSLTRIPATRSSDLPPDSAGPDWIHWNVFFC